jgi:hypothetical protein
MVVEVEVVLQLKVMQVVLEAVVVVLLHFQILMEQTVLMV